METLLKDLRYGYRTLLRNPGFTLVAVLSLALGIGANTAIFSFLNTILLRQLPVKDPQNLVLFGEGRSRGSSSVGSGEMFSWRACNDFRAANRVFEDVIAVDTTTNRVYPDFGGAREGITATLVSGNFFHALGIKPEAGQIFDTGVDHAASPVAVLSDAFWARRFHRNREVVGHTFRLSNHDYTIIGVAARGFFGTRVGEVPDMWVPLTMQSDFANADFVQLDDPKSNFLNLIGRLKPGVTLERAEANVNVVYRQFLAGYVADLPGPRQQVVINHAKIKITPADKGLSSIRRKYQTSLIVLMAVVGLVLAIACANVANLLVALSAKRQREMAVRIAMGAARSRIARQLLTEGVVLAAAAGLLGVALASLAGRVLVSLISTGPQELPLGFELDLCVLAFTIGVSLLTGILFSLAPALRAGRVDLNTSLKEGKASMASPRKVTFGNAIVVGQVALSLILLVAAGLLLRSFQNLVATSTGFDRDNVLLFKIDSESSGYKQEARLGDLYSRIEDRVSHTPGAASAAVALYSFHEGGWNETFTVPGLDLPDKDRDVSLNFVTPGYFRTFHIAVLAGGTFNKHDTANSPLSVVIGERFARKIFGGLDVVGKTFLMAPLTAKDVPFRVIGVVRDFKTESVRDDERNFAVLSLAQCPVYAGNVAVRVSGNPGTLAAEVRSALHNIEPNLPIRWTTTLAEEVSDSLVSERALAELCGFFSALALMLSAIGLYGTISFTVARRTSEIGIRMALGAERTGVLAMVLKDAMVLVAIGVGIGLPLSFAAGRALQSQLYQLGPFDAFTAAIATVALTLVAALAGYLPARRAARVDPMIALRYE